VKPPYRTPTSLVLLVCLAAAGFLLAADPHSQPSLMIHRLEVDRTADGPIIRGMFDSEAMLGNFAIPLSVPPPTCVVCHCYAGSGNPGFCQEFWGQNRYNCSHCAGASGCIPNTGSCCCSCYQKSSGCTACTA